MEFLMNNLNLLAGGVAGTITLWALKKIPNEELYAWVKTCSYATGVALTLGLSKWKWTKSIWNKTIEPYFVDLIDNTIGAAVKGFVDGLRSDN